MASQTLFQERIVAALRAMTLPNSSTFVRVMALLGVVVVLLSIIEQVVFVYRRIKYRMSGPMFVTPFVGAIVTMVLDPYGFWERMRAYAMDGDKANGAACHSIAGSFMVFLTDVDAARKVFHENSPNDFVMVLHPNGERILGPNNIAFQTGPRHKALRNSFLPLFSRKALGMYLGTQMGLINKFLDDWIETSRTKPGEYEEMRGPCTDLNRLTSQMVFAGPYIDDHTLFSKWYKEMTDGFLTLPFYFPGSALWSAVEARKKVVQVLMMAARRSKAAMAAGKEPSCLLDFWTRHVLEIIKDAEAAGKPAPDFTHDFEMGETVMDFMFAAQDASTSSLVWCIHYMGEHPEHLARVREEQARIRPNNEPLCYENLEQMTFARQIVKEILRLRCPPPMVPHLAKRDYQLTDDISVPKGALVIPSTWNCCLQGFTDPLKFDPDRMSPERQEDVKYQRNYIPFGTGPHLCVGREYAMNHLMAFLAQLATRCDWERKRDGEEQKIIYMPSLYPGSCLVSWRPRGAPASWREEAGAAEKVLKPALTGASSSKHSDDHRATGTTAGWQRRWPSADTR